MWKVSQAIARPNKQNWIWFKGRRTQLEDIEIEGQHYLFFLDFGSNFPINIEGDFPDFPRNNSSRIGLPHLQTSDECLSSIPIFVVGILLSDFWLRDLNIYLWKIFLSASITVIFPENDLNMINTLILNKESVNAVKFWFT